MRAPPPAEATGTSLADATAPRCPSARPPPAPPWPASSRSARRPDNVGVAGVQFRIDGPDIGTEDTTSPYTGTWDTTATTAEGRTSVTARSPRRRGQPHDLDRGGGHRRRRGAGRAGAGRGVQLRGDERGERHRRHRQGAYGHHHGRPPPRGRTAVRSRSTGSAASSRSLTPSNLRLLDRDDARTVGEPVERQRLAHRDPQAAHGQSDLRALQRRRHQPQRHHHDTAAPATRRPSGPPP